MAPRRLSPALTAMFFALICSPTALSFSAHKYTSVAPDVAKASSVTERPSDHGSSVDTTARRRDALQTVAAAVLGASLLAFPPPSSAETVSVLRSGGCYRGEGEACDELAGDNELIRSLQKKSVENREMNDREALNAYNMKNFPDYFASLNPPKYLVKQPDGTFSVYTDDELSELKKAGRIKVETAKTKGGKFADLTQKPMLVLVEK